MSPTKRQFDALRFIRGYQLANGFSPAFGEIVAGIGLTSKSRAHYLLHGLAERGWIRRLPNRWRAIEIVRPVAIPRAPDGAPLYVVPGFGP